jgi:(1->4)-alpha-D-glucan 1-alpha-D-glucosylmutase
MTTLSTHDTKRSEDARAQLAGLAELPLEWANAVRHWHELGAKHRSPDGWPDRETEYLFWQTVVATWSLSSGSAATGSDYTRRITEYLSKATREAKLHTSWTSPDPDYDRAVEAYATAVLADPAVLAAVAAFCAELAEPTRVAVLGQKLLQLTMPGVADVYQGTEIVDRSLVDPDNRRPVDYGRRSRLLTLLDDDRSTPETLAALPAADRLDAEKLLVTSRALRLRREHPDWFVGGGYLPVATSAGNAIAFGRAPAAAQGFGADQATVIAVATRLPVARARYGGWGEHTVTLPPGDWTDLLTGRQVPGSSCRLADLLSDLPVALLTRTLGP